MADVNIGAKITVDSTQGTKSIAEMQGEIKKLSQELRNAKIGSDEYKEASVKLGAAQKELSASTGEKVKSFDALKTSIRSTIPALDGASTGVSSFGKQLWALAANPIVLVITAIVGALVLLYKAFASTEEGADKISFAMDAIGKVIEVIRDRVLKFAGAITKLMSGDFKGAMEQGKAAVTGFGEQAKAEFNKAYEAAQKLDEIADRMDALTVSRAKLDAQIAKAREKFNDETASIGERKKAYEEVSEAEKKQSAEELKAAKDKFDQLQIMHSEQIKNNTLNESQRKQLQDAESAYYKADEASQQTRFRLNKMNSSIRRQEVEAWTEMFLNQQEKEKQALNALYQVQLDEYNNRKRLRNREKGDVVNYYADLKKAQKEEDERKKKGEELMQQFMKESNESGLGHLLAIKAKEVYATYSAAEAQKAIDQSVIDNKRLLFQQEVELALQIADLLGRQTAVGKAIAIATATINTYQAATESLKANYSVFGPAAMAAKIVATASTIALGLQQVKSIIGVNVPGGGIGGSMPAIGSSGTTLPAPLSPTASTTTINQNQINQIGNATNRAYVLDTDIQNNRERITRITRAARIG